MHLGQPHERDQRRGRDAPRECLRGGTSPDPQEDQQLQDAGDPDPEPPECDGTDDGRPIGDEIAAAGGRLQDPPGIPGSEREDREQRAVVHQVPEVPGGSRGRNERNPQQRNRGQADGRRPDGSPPATRREEPGRERNDQRQRLRLGHEADRDRHCRPARPPTRRQDPRDEHREDIDGFELRPQPGDVGDRGVEQDAQDRDHRPAGTVAQGPADDRGDPEVGDRRRKLDQHECGRVVRGCVQQSRRHRTEEPPDPG